MLENVKAFSQHLDKTQCTDNLLHYLRAIVLIWCFTRPVYLGSCYIYLSQIKTKVFRSIFIADGLYHAANQFVVFRNQAFVDFISE